jgi:hypothetical protein
MILPKITIQKQRHMGIRDEQICSALAQESKAVAESMTD